MPFYGTPQFILLLRANRYITTLCAPRLRAPDAFPEHTRVTLYRPVNTTTWIDTFATPAGLTEPKPTLRPSPQLLFPVIPTDLLPVCPTWQHHRNVPLATIR